MKSRYTPDNFNRKEMNPENYKWGLFYFNPGDSRVIVPKRLRGMGWTMNFANLWTYVILGTIIVVAILVGTLDK
jgi:uncharacterized membrane protein